jgi:NACalpha-BTF3-like transcription factor
MKSVKSWILPLILVGTLIFIFSTRENLEDTQGVQGPPYGKTPVSAQNIINVMTPELLKNLKKRMGVTSSTLTDAEKVRLVHGDGTNNSPISQVMSNFYWQVYKTSTSTITIAQVNTFLNNQNDSWINSNTADLRDFLKRYFLEDQGTQSGYGDILNSVWGATAVAAASKPKETKKESKKETKTEPVKTDMTQRLITIAAIGLAAFSILVALIVFLLPSRV